MARRAFLLCVLLISLRLQAQSDLVGSRITIEKQSPRVATPLGAFYGLVEMRQRSEDYFDPQGDERTNGSVETLAQLGSQYYGGALDMFLTFGAYKDRKTLQLKQNQPTAEIDVTPVAGTYGTICQYTIASLPYQRQDPSSDTGKDGVTYTIGLAPTIMFPMTSESGVFTPKAGLDGWTMLYSRQQSATVSPRETDHYSLDGSDEHGGAPNGGQVEDYAQEYHTEVMAGFSFQPAFSKAVSAEFNGYYDTAYVPRYQEIIDDRTGETSVGYVYGAERTSRYRVRLAYAVTDRLTVINDFYHYHEGFFSTKVRDDDQPRMTNLVRVNYKL